MASVVSRGTAATGGAGGGMSGGGNHGTSSFLSMRPSKMLLELKTGIYGALFVTAKKVRAWRSPASSR
jgi:hypothetical protein